MKKKRWIVTAILMIFISILLQRTFRAASMENVSNKRAFQTTSERLLYAK